MNCAGCGSFWYPYGGFSRLVKVEDDGFDGGEVPYHSTNPCMPDKPHLVLVRIPAPLLTGNQKGRAIWKYGGYWVEEGGDIYREVYGDSAAAFINERRE